MKTCLVVDDTKFDRMILEKCASRMQLNVDIAQNGKEAIAKCRETLPDYILLDWEMADMSGIEVLKAIRGLEGGEHVNIFMCTSHSHASFVGHAYIKGANGFITKPVTMTKLEDALTSNTAPD